MNLELARNIAIIVAIALVVWLVPGGGDGAALVGQILGAAFIVMVVLMLIRLYRQFQGEIFSLGDPWRFALYAAVGVAVVTVAASRRLFDLGAAGTMVWLALLAGSSYMLFAVWQRYRAY